MSFPVSTLTYLCHFFLYAMICIVFYHRHRVFLMFACSSRISNRYPQTNSKTAQISAKNIPTCKSLALAFDTSKAIPHKKIFDAAFSSARCVLSLHLSPYWAGGKETFSWVRAPIQRKFHSSWLHLCKLDVQCKAKSSLLCIELRVALWCGRCRTVPASSATRNVKQFWIFFMSSLKAIFHFSFSIFTEMCQVMAIFLALRRSRLSHGRFMEMGIRFQNGRSQISKAWCSATHMTWIKGHLSINFVWIRAMLGTGILIGIKL